MRSIFLQCNRVENFFRSNVSFLLIKKPWWFISYINRLHCVIHWHSRTKPTAAIAWILSMWNTLSYCTEKLFIFSVQILINSLKFIDSCSRWSDVRLASEARLNKIDAHRNFVRCVQIFMIGLQRTRVWFVTAVKLTDSHMFTSDNRTCWSSVFLAILWLSFIDKKTIHSHWSVQSVWNSCFWIWAFHNNT